VRSELSIKGGYTADHWPLPYKIKALYMCDDDCPSVALQQSIPYEPKLFALIHELKHHYCDRAALGTGVIHCGDYDANELIEKGAEVFAAEFIYPRRNFAEDLQRLGVTIRDASHVVEVKRSCKAKVSYTLSANGWRGLVASPAASLAVCNFRSWKSKSTACLFIAAAANPSLLEPRFCT